MNTPSLSLPVVLIVDDDVTFRLLAREALERDDITVLEAEDGIEALEMFDTNQVDLVIADGLMPRMDGFALCRALRTRPDTLYLPVLMVTGLEDLASVAQAYAAGATDFIIKPLNWLILSQRVRYMLRAGLAFNEVRTAKEATEAANRQLNLLEHIATAANQAKSVQEIFTFALNEVCRFMEWQIGHVYLTVSRETGTFLESASIWCANGHELNGEFRALTERAVSIADAGLPGQAYETAVPAWIADLSESPQDPRFAAAGVKAGAAFTIRIGNETIAVFELFSRDVRPADAGLVRLLAQIGGQLAQVVERTRAEDRLFHQAMHDALTGLPNRVLFLNYLKQALEHAKRDPKHLFATIFVDLDQFKIVNDSLGHQAGDTLLIEVGSRLSNLLRTADILSRGSIELSKDSTRHTLARLGGDEFTVLVDNLRDPSDAVRVVERIQSALQAPFFLAGQEIYTAASIGISIGGAGYSSSEEILRDADIAMYRAKSLGKGRYAMFDQAMHAAAIKRLALENDLRRGVQNEEFVVFYQPIVDLDTGKIAGFEALLRWSRPGAGLVAPGEFIGVVEETGLIIPLGQWIFREACRQLHAWHQEFRLPKPLTMSINLSARQIDHPALVAQIKQALEETGVDPTTVRLEITESATMTNIANTIDILGQLGALGLQFSLDDFGTGYSSLSLLHKLPFDILKIDRSFVMTIDSNRESWNIARTIMNLAQSLDLKVVAEGTERAEQTAALQSLGCNFVQGYLYSRPVDAAAIGQMLAPLRPVETAPLQAASHA